LIPALKTYKIPLVMPKNVFGLVGPIASGKGTVAGFLKERGYSVYSLSDRIREEITKRGLEITRDTLNEVSNELRGTLGSDILAKRTSELIEKDNPDLVVVDAIRNPAEVSYIKNTFGAKIIGVVADQQRRFDFFKNRGTNKAGVSTWEEFKDLDDRELSQAGSYRQQVKACLELADTIIENNGTIADLKLKVEEVIGKLSS